MKTLLIRLVAAGSILTSANSALAVRSYQVTGPILEVTSTKIVIQKGKEKWEIDQTPGTKINGDLKVGAKATIEYTMVAETVKVKPETAAAPPKK